MGVTAKYPLKDSLFGNIDNYLPATNQPNRVEGKYFNWILKAIVNAIPNSSIIYVNASTGSDTEGDGSDDTPYATIGFAETKAKPGNKLQIAAGSYTESNLGKNGLVYDFANGAIVTVATAQTLWNDAINGYTVLGQGSFVTAPGETSSIFMNFFYSTRSIYFECKNVAASCNYAVVNISNTGYGLRFKGDIVENTSTGTSGRVFRVGGSGINNGYFVSDFVTSRTSVQGTSYFGTLGENGTVYCFAGNASTCYVKCSNVTNTNSTSIAPVFYLRTGVTGRVHFNGDVNMTYDTNTWLSAGILHQGGQFWHEGSSIVTNGSSYNGSNFGGTHLFRHIGGQYVSTNNSAVALQGTGPSGDQLSYVFDGHYESTNSANNAVIDCLGLWEGQLYFGMSDRFSIRQNTPGKAAIYYADNYGGANLTFGNGFVYMQDPADLIINGVGTPQFDIQGIVSSNGSGIYAGATVVPATQLVTDVNYKNAPLPTDVTTRWTVVQW